MKKFSFLLFFISAWSWAHPYIVLFKQNEIGMAGLGHEAYQSLLKTANNKNIKELSEWMGRRGKRTAIKDLWLVRGANVDLEVEDIEMLGGQPWVKRVYPDKKRKYINPIPDLKVVTQPTAETRLWGLDKIGLNKIKKEFPELDGRGVRVAILDTGIQSHHPEFTAETRKKLVFKDFVNPLIFPYDDNGHGTHVAGTIAGSQVGIAPNVDLIIAKTFTAIGYGSDADILQAMQWLYDPDGNPETADYPRIVSNSWGMPLPSDVTIDISAFDFYRLALQSWIQGGIIPVFAAGNSGTRPNGIPAGLPEALSVAASTVNGEAAYFSSLGPNIWREGATLWTLFKPDVSAPGENIISAIPDNAYAEWSGTSMATPHVAGLIALALQLKPHLSYAEIKNLLMRTTDQKIDLAQGYGTVDGYKLIKLLTGTRGK